MPRRTKIEPTFFETVAELDKELKAINEPQAPKAFRLTLQFQYIDAAGAEGIAYKTLMGNDQSELLVRGWTWLNTGLEHFENNRIHLIPARRILQIDIEEVYAQETPLSSE